MSLCIGEEERRSTKKKLRKHCSKKKDPGKQGGEGIEEALHYLTICERISMVHLHSSSLFEMWIQFGPLQSSLERDKQKRIKWRLWPQKLSSSFCCTQTKKEGILRRNEFLQEMQSFRTGEFLSADHQPTDDLKIDFHWFGSYSISFNRSVCFVVPSSQNLALPNRLRADLPSALCSPSFPLQDAGSRQRISHCRYAHNS